MGRGGGSPLQGVGQPVFIRALRRNALDQKRFSDLRLMANPLRQNIACSIPKFAIVSSTVDFGRQVSAELHEGRSTVKPLQLIQVEFDVGYWVLLSTDTPSPKRRAKSLIQLSFCCGIGRSGSNTIKTPLANGGIQTAPDQCQTPGLLLVSLPGGIHTPSA